MINKQQVLTLATLVVGGFGLGGVSAAIHGFATPEPIKLTKSEPPKKVESPSSVTTPKISPSPSPSVTSSQEEDTKTTEEEEIDPVKPIKTKIINNPEPQTKRTVKRETTRKRVVRDNDDQEVVVKRKRRVRVEPEVERPSPIAPKVITKNYNRRSDIKNNDDDKVQEPKVRKRRRIVDTQEQTPKIERRQNTRRIKKDDENDFKKNIESTPVKRRQRDLDDEPKAEKPSRNQTNLNKPEVEKAEGRAQDIEPKLTTKEPINETPQEIEQEEN